MFNEKTRTFKINKQYATIVRGGIKINNKIYSFENAMKELNLNEEERQDFRDTCLRYFPMILS